MLAEYLSEFVYGGIDGTITTMAVVAASAGANLPTNIIIILGLANVFADGFSMGISRYLSATAETKNVIHSPFASGLATMLSFIIIGMIPLAAFIYAYLMQKDGDLMYPYAYLLTALAFIIVGSIKGKITKNSYSKGALQTLIVGGTGAVISYLIGRSLQGLA